MSHFTVLVIGRNPEEQLAPFNEDYSQLPKESLTFVDQEEEFRKEYENEGSMMVNVDGKYVYPWDEQFRNPGSFGTGSDTHTVPPHLEKEHVPHKSRFATFEEFCSQYNSAERDEETGHYGYWKNEKAKWDWYQLGGRWAGFFKLKPGQTGNLGDYGTFDNAPKDFTADQAFKFSIDFQGMRDEKAKEALQRYQEVMSIANGTPEHKTWEEVRAELPNVDDARRKYGNQQRIQVLRANGVYEADDFKVSQEVYIKQAYDRAITTFAVLKDGEWFSKGSMGWWGIVTDEKEQNKWNEEFNKMIERLPDDALLSVYDCHI